MFLAHAIDLAPIALKLQNLEIDISTSTVLDGPRLHQDVQCTIQATWVAPLDILHTAKPEIPISLIQEAPGGHIMARLRLLHGVRDIVLSQNMLRPRAITNGRSIARCKSRGQDGDSLKLSYCREAHIDRRTLEKRQGLQSVRFSGAIAPLNILHNLGTVKVS